MSKNTSEKGNVSATENIRKLEWRKVGSEEFLNEENVSRVFDLEGSLLEQEPEPIKPPTGCFAFLKNAPKPPPYLKRFVQEGYKSGKVTIYEEKSLGKGGFGEIMLGKLKVRSKARRSFKKMKIAVKSINHEKMRRKNHDDDEIVAMIGDEIKAMIRCQNENVIGLHFVFVYKDETLIGMELAERGSLLDHFWKSPKGTCMRWFTKTMDAVSFCHSRGVMHLDIKPDNVLLDKDFNVKIADFGVSEVVEDLSELSDEESFMVESQGGTQCYMAPEMMYGEERNGKKCDVWSLGVMMYEMLLNMRPFDDAVVDAVSSKVTKMKKKRGSREKIRQYLREVYNINHVYFPPDIPLAPKVIICAMLNFDPDKRPYLDQITALSWISKFREQSCSNNQRGEPRPIKIQQQSSNNQRCEPRPIKIQPQSSNNQRCEPRPIKIQPQSSKGFWFE